jgi:choline dehydrogenase
MPLATLVAAMRYASQHGHTALLAALRATAAYQALKLGVELSTLQAPRLHPGTAAFRAQHADVRRVPEAEIEHRFDASWLGADGAAREFDFIIVGAGSAGCALARRLSSCASATVLLIECGPEAQNAGAVATPHKMVSLWRSEVDWGLRSTPQAHLRPSGRVVDLERGKTLGGSSSINYMMWVRGAREDFDRWDAQYGAGPEWSHKGVLPNFKALERVSRESLGGNPGAVSAADLKLRGGAGPLELSVLHPPLAETTAFLKTAGRVGLAPTADYNGAHMAERAAQVQTTVTPQGGRRADAFTVFVEPLLRSRKNLHIASQGFVRRVLLGASPAEAEAERAKAGYTGAAAAASEAGAAGASAAAEGSSSSSEEAGGAGNKGGGSGSGSGSGSGGGGAAAGSGDGATSLPRARGVELELPDGRRIELHARREVVLCAGAIMTPQLLMLSGIGDRAELRRHGIHTAVDLPGVGKNLQDHPYVPLAGKAADGAHGLPVLSNGGLSGLAFHKTKLNEARERAQGHARGPDAELIFMSRIDALSYGPKTLVHKLELALPSLKSSALLAPLYHGTIRLAEALFSLEALRTDVLRVLGVSCEYNQPSARGSVRLASADPHAHPLVDLRLLDHPEDMAAMIEGMKKARTLMTTPPLSDLVAEWLPEAEGCDAWDDAAWTEYILERAQTTWHYSCTARMGRAGDPEAVVDNRLRVFGVRGLRCGDASVWPCITSGNTNAPAMMTGDKCGELILKDHAISIALTADPKAAAAIHSRL